jgi:ribose transport system substrate-binding protein
MWCNKYLSGALALGVAVGLAACSSGSSHAVGGDSGSPAATSASSSAGSSSAGSASNPFTAALPVPKGGKSQQLTYYRAQVKLAEQTATWSQVAPDKPSPPIAKSKKILIIDCTAKGLGCVLQGQGAAQAAKALGWSSKTVDGQGLSSVQNSEILQAVAQHYNGIYMNVIDSNSVESGLAAARAAHIPIVSSLSANPVGNGPDSVYADVEPNHFQTGVNLSDWAIADANGKPVNYAVFYLSADAAGLERTQGFVAGMKRCKWCQLVGGYQVYDQQNTNNLPLRMESLLQAHPSINYVYLDVGPYVYLLNQGLREAGPIAKNVKIVSFDCVTDQVQRLRSGTPYDANCEGNASLQAGWAAVDELNRAFNNAPQANDKVAAQLFTKQNIGLIKNLKIGYDAGFNYQSYYLKLWKIS